MGHHLEQCTIYAVDFDGTLCEHKFPDIGAPNMKLIKWLISKRNEGDKVILWTNRMGERLKEAVKWCEEKGLFFDAVNDNIPEVMERYKEILNGKPPSRKITADIFIDDAACSEGLPFTGSTTETCGGCQGCSTDCWRSTQL